MAGMTDLEEMLRTLTVSVRAEHYTFVDVASGTFSTADDGVDAVIAEVEGDTLVATIRRAEVEGWPIDFVAAWLTLDVHSALEAVGLTAAFSVALGEAGIPCNVLAGYHHDHLLVPADRAGEAVSVLESLRDR